MKSAIGVGILLALALPSICIAQTIPVVVVRNYDGDTVTVDAKPWPGMSIRTSVRVNGIDTPERRQGCPESRAKALEARTMLADLMAAAEVVSILNPFHGRYAGRVVANLLVDGQDVGPMLVAAGLALPYDGGRRQDWCVVLGAEP